MTELVLCARCENHEAGPSSLCRSCYEVFGRYRKKNCDQECTVAGFIADVPRGSGGPRVAKKKRAPSKVETPPTTVPSVVYVIRPELAAFEEIKELIPGFAISSPASDALAEKIKKFAKVTHPICVVGEMGTGKEHVARALHQLSPRKDKPYVVVNCGSLTPDLADNELFGHTRGAYTGATEGSSGLYGAANGGTIVLDEIATMHPQVQVKLLRVLENKEVRKVGATKVEPVDVRVISITNKPLTELLEDGTFRPDLYYRLTKLTISTVPLRDRRVEIMPLTQHLMSKLTDAPYSFDDRTFDLLCQYEWRGNVRELEGVLLEALIMADGAIIEPRHLPERLQRSHNPHPRVALVG